MPLLKLENVSFRYPQVSDADTLPVLCEVNLTLERGDAVSIIGPSGSGKSTLLNIIGGLERPTAGSVLLNGQDLAALGDAALARVRNDQIGFIFQDHHLLPQCTALENVLLPRLALGSVGRDDGDRARKLLERVGLSDRTTHMPAELSGGERQRVAVARALMNAPALILADEPTGNLDASAAASVGDLLAAVASEARAVLIVVTHSADLSRRFAQRMRMSDGQLVDDA